MDTRRAGGLGLLAYGIGTPVAFMSIGAPGGDYRAGTITTYMSSGHWAVAFVLAYLGAFASLGLLVWANGMKRELGGAAATVRGLALAGMSAGVVGWFLVGGLSVSFAEGGRSVFGAVPHPVVYVMSEMSNLVAVCASAFFVGAAALVVAVRLRGRIPGWLRVASYVAGPCGLFAPLFFPLFLFWIWAIVFGAWLARVPAAERVPALST
jgi:hypothetical protein